MSNKTNNRLSPEEKQDIFDQVLNNIDRWNRRKYFRLYLAASTVACIALLVVFFYPSFITHNNNLNEENLLVDNRDSIVNSRDIQLVLADNKTITVDKNADIIYNKQDEIIVNTVGKQIKAKKAESAETELNTLIVPKGRRSNLTLSDGTKLWVNSGSRLRFPSTFKTDKREIWVEGEIYIEVAKDKDKVFQVNTSRMQIDVTGTCFNVTAYNEDKEQAVVLVEGSVNVNVREDIFSLLPNQIFSVTENDFSTKKNIDVTNYISWKDGYLRFSSETLTNILTRLSRYYNIPISCDEQIKDLKCNGKLVLFDNIEDVMKTISNTIPVSYIIEDGRIDIYNK